MSPEQSQYIWRKTIPHIEVGMGSGVFTSHRSARFPYGYLVTTSPQSKTPPWYAPIRPPKAFVALVRFQLHVPELQRTIRTEAIFPDSLRLTALLPISSALAAIKLKRTLEKKGLRLRKAPATFLLTAQLRAGTQLVALARHSAPRLTSAAKTFSLGACLSNTKRGFRSL
ncbi:hypothetical protein L1887_41725 [Cichorium endivia]|nr:hypothetical protein L1887_41725 [Cichorium endivia]